MRNHLIVAVEPGKAPGLTDATPRGFCLLRGRDLARLMLPTPPAGATLYRVGTSVICASDEEAESTIRAVARPQGIDITFPVYTLASRGRPTRAGELCYTVKLDVFGNDAASALASHFGGHVRPVNEARDPRRNWIGRLVVDTHGASAVLPMVLRAYDRTATLDGGLHA